ncbi:MAG: hypothetical protein IJZ11_09190 [Bacteroidaceae bacterium]|nr:hypothetical protein [Bacteroidaceae bacterium]
MGFIGKIIVSTNKTEGLQACIKITLGGGKGHRQWRQKSPPVAVLFTATKDQIASSIASSETAQKKSYSTEEP